MSTYGVHPRVPGLVAPDRNQADRFPGVHSFRRQIDKRLQLAKECIAQAQAQAQAQAGRQAGRHRQRQAGKQAGTGRGTGRQASRQAQAQA